MQPQYLRSLITIAVVLSVLSFSCRKSNSAEDISFASDQATSEQTYNDIQCIADQAATTTGSLAYRTTGSTSSACAEVTHTGDSIIINFGTSDCMCRDGRNRRGEIIVIFTGGSYANTGSVHTITFNNYYENDNKITGSKTVTNMGNNASGQPYFNIQVDCKVTLNGGGTISCSWNRVRTIISGTSLTDPNAVFQVTGSGTMTSAKGIEMSISIAKPLVITPSCHWIEAGTIVYAFGNKSRSLDYGDTPACDNLATLTLSNGNTRAINLP